MKLFNDTSIYQGIVQFMSPIGEIRAVKKDFGWAIYILDSDNETFIYQASISSKSNNPKFIYKAYLKSDIN